MLRTQRTLSGGGGGGGPADEFEPSGWGGIPGLEVVSSRKKASCPCLSSHSIPSHRCTGGYTWGMRKRGLLLAGKAAGVLAARASASPSSFAEAPDGSRRIQLKFWPALLVGQCFITTAHSRKACVDSDQDLI